MEHGESHRKTTLTFRVNWFSTKVPTHFIGGKDSFKRWCCGKWISMCKKMNSDSYLIPYIKSNSKQITDLNVRAKPKILEENSKFLRSWVRQIFLKHGIKSMVCKKKIDQLELIKIQNFCISKETVKNEKTSNNNKKDKQLGSNICKTHLIKYLFLSPGLLWERSSGGRWAGGGDDGWRVCFFLLVISIYHKNSEAALVYVCSTKVPEGAKQTKQDGVKSVGPGESS